MLLATAATPVVAAITPLVALLIRLDDRGPVFYKSRRLGFEGIPFDMLKFRTMRVDSQDYRNEDGTTFNSEEDPRVTRLGALLRRTSIDELPQIVNVLRGEMSFVGPRPSPIPTEDFLIDNYGEKFKVRPGLTGLAQAFARNSGSLTLRQSLDLEYVKSPNLIGDLKILLRTASTVYSGKNLHRNVGRMTEEQPCKADIRQASRIIFATTTCTGAPSLYRGQLAWFSRRGWEPILVCSPSDKGRELAAREGVEYAPVPMERQISLVADLRSLVAWLQLMRRVRPVAVNVGTPKAGLLGGAAAFLTGVPRRVYTVRGLRLEGEQRLKRGLLWVMERAASAFATDVIAVSPSLAQELIRLRLVPRHKVWITGSGSSNGVDAVAVQEAMREASSSELRGELGATKHDFIVGFIGRLNRDKGVDTLLDAMGHTQNPNIRLVLVGAVDGEDMRALVQNADERVVLTGWTPDPWRFLSAFDAVCLPTKREGFPNVVLEAAAAGLPSVVSRATGAVDSVVNGETGLHVEIGDAEGLALALDSLANDPSMAAAFGRAARARVLQHFGQEPVWLGIEEVICALEQRSYSENPIAPYSRGKRS